MDIYEGLENETYDRNYKDKELVKRILQYFKPYKTQMTIVIFLLILVTVLEIFVPITISRVVDLIAVNDDNNIVELMCVMLISIGIIKYISNYIKTMLSSKVVGNVVLELRNSLYKKVLGLDLFWFDNQLTGKIVNRVMNDTAGFANVVTLMIDLLSYMLIILSLTIWLSIINVYLTGLLIIMMLLAIVVSMAFRYLARKVSNYARRSEANISFVIQESISGMMTAKIFRKEEMVYVDFIKNNRQYYKINIRRGLIFCVIYPLIAMLSGIGIAVIIYVGSHLYEIERISTGSWLLFIQAEAYFWYPMMKIASFWSLFQEGLTCSERVFSLLDTEKKVKQTDALLLKNTIAEFEFQDVKFSYEGREDFLKNFNLIINRGEKLALVGQTGSGKTTILKLIARYNEFQSGYILINGVDIRQIDIKDYRRRLGMISQTPYLFSGTIEDNIIYGNEGASNQDILVVVNAISDGEWLKDFPNGLETQVGECGNMISAGQQQLVALARVMLKDPDVLILDEATANIDPFTEAQLQNGLQKLMQNRTVIMIAHRISTLNSSDRIVVIDRGKIIEQGSQEQLIEKQGVYRDMYSKFYDLQYNV